MDDFLFSIGSKKWSLPPARLAGALARAAMAIGELNQAINNHPLAVAILYRTRLDAVRRMAAVDGKLVDQWSVAAAIEGLRFRTEPGGRIIEISALFDAVFYALGLYGWLAMPNEDQDRDILLAAKSFEDVIDPGHPLLTAAIGLHTWLDNGGDRSSIRAALVRFWGIQGVLPYPLPLTGAGALLAETSWEPDRWLLVFFDSLVTEAMGFGELIRECTRAWRVARMAVADRRRNSHAPAAVDILAATPLLSATSLAAAVGMSIKSATALLDELRSQGVVIEVSHRTKRRLYALPTMAPFRDVALPRSRRQPGRGRGRPREILQEEVLVQLPSPAPVFHEPLPSFSVNYSDLDRAMAQADEANRRARAFLSSFLTK
jgi:predicted transcriptional regulator